MANYFAGPVVLRCLLILTAITILIALAFFGIRAPEVYLSSWVRQLIFGYIPGVLFGLSILLFFGSVRAQKLFLLYLTAGGVSVWGGEFFIQHTGWTGNRDNITAKEVLETSLKEQEGRHLPMLCSTRLHRPSNSGELLIDGRAFLPLSGIPSTPFLFTDERGNSTLLRSDEYGFNNPPGQWQRGKAIAMVGDSFTFGAGATPGQSYVDTIRQILSIPVINLGCGGNGPLTELGTIREYLPTMRPRLVIWFFYEGNDLTKDLEREYQNAMLQRYLIPDFSQRLANYKDQITSALKVWIAQSRRTTALEKSGMPEHHPQFNFVNWVTLQSLRTALGLRNEWSVENETRFINILKLANEEIEGWGGKLAFVVIPSNTRYLTALGNLDASEFEDRLTQQIRRLGIDTFELSAILEKEPAPESLYDGHFNDKGHGVAGRSIANWIRGLLN